MLLKGTHSPGADRSRVGGLGLPNWSAQGPEGLSGAPEPPEGRRAEGHSSHSWLTVGLGSPTSLFPFLLPLRTHSRHCGARRPRAGRSLATSGSASPGGLPGGEAWPESPPLLE